MSLPRAHGGPAARGVLKASPADFQVVEHMHVRPEGEGEHLWLEIEKCGWNTEDVALLLAKQAGADNVINPVRFTGLLLAGSAQGAHIADYLADLASVSGRVQLIERPVLPEEVGKPLSEITTGGKGLRIYRNGGAHGFWEHEAKTMREGDIVVEIRPTDVPVEDGEFSSQA